jgi:hypothetical protein
MCGFRAMLCYAMLCFAVDDDEGVGAGSTCVHGRSCAWGPVIFAFFFSGARGAGPVPWWAAGPGRKAGCGAASKRARAPSRNVRCARERDRERARFCGGWGQPATLPPRGGDRLGSHASAGPAHVLREQWFGRAVGTGAGGPHPPAGWWLRCREYPHAGSWIGFVQV